MRKSNKIMVILIIVLLSASGCKNQIVTQSTTVDLAQHYDTIDDLKQGASNIVEVEVLDNNVVIHGEMPFTISNVKVLSTIKGDIVKGDKIKVLETGGIYKSSGKNPNDKKGQKFDMKLGGISVMQSGEHLILFVKPFIGPQATDAYVPLGVWQGKFKVEKGSNGKVEQQAPNEYKLKDYKPVTLSEFIKKIKD